MLKNYLKIVIRNLRKHKVYSFINIFGLAVGMACCILILLYISDELSFENFHENKDRIYKIHTYSSIGATTRHYSTVPPIIAAEFAASIPEVEAAVRNFDSFNLQGRTGDNDVNLENIFWVDPSFFQVFTHNFVSGDSQRAFENPDSLIITQETAQLLFGDENPMGKIISLPGDREIQITGVLENVPKNSQFQFNGLMPSTFFRDREGNPGGILTADYFCQVYGYLLLKQGVDPRIVEQKIARVTEEKWGEVYAQRGTSRTYLLQKFRDVHLRSDYEYDLGTAGDINNVYLFSAIALFVLIIACFNFINLSTARSASRGREVGMRKVLGSTKGQLVKQFLSESIVLSLISLALSILLVLTVLPAFNSLSGKEFEAHQLMNLPILIGLAGIVVLTGIVAGSFPAFILSSSSPVQVLRGKLSSASKNSVMRKILVVCQFTISAFMIIGIITMVRQLDYMKNKDLGFDRENLVVVNFVGDMHEEARAQRFEAMKEEMIGNPGIISVAFSANVPGRDLGRDAYLQEGKSNDETVRAQNYWVGYDFIDAYGIELVHGRNFSRQYATDANLAVLLNEKALALFGWSREEALGKRIINVPRENRPGVVVGIVKDFHNTNMKDEIGPSILSHRSDFFSFLTVRIHSENVSQTLAYLEDFLGGVSREVAPNRPFNFTYFFVDDDFRNKYPEEDKVREIYLVFGVLAILIACLGLFGLASFTIEQRTKEIGVRKVLGASIRNVVFLLSKEFTKLVLVSNIVAWPLAYWAMHRWLGNFAYRVGIALDIFLLTGIATVIIALFTISFHSVRASLSNPIDSLRYE